MNTKLKFSTIGALTAALLSLSTALTAGTVSHTTILDAYDSAYTTGGVIIHSDDDDFTTLTTLQLPYDPVKLCNVFGEHVEVIIFTKPDHSLIYLDCSL